MSTKINTDMGTAFLWAIILIRSTEIPILFLKGIHSKESQYVSRALELCVSSLSHIQIKQQADQNIFPSNITQLSTQY